MVSELLMGEDGLPVLCAANDPFEPGPGGLPSVLAGREPCIDEIRSRTSRLEVGRPPSDDLLFVGPRGMGKTAMMNWVMNDIDEEDSRTFLYMSCKGIDSIQAFNTKLFGTIKESENTRPGSNTEMRIALNLGVVQGELKRSEHNRSSIESLNLLTSHLSFASQNGPLVLCLDEAQEADPSALGYILNESQSFRNFKRKPILFVVGGTPGLSVSGLREAGSSFWNRSEKVKFGLLDNQSSRDVVSLPLVKQGVSFGDDSMLDNAIAESQCYPFFLQVLGRALYRCCMREDRRVIDHAMFERAMAAFAARKEALYADVYKDIQQAGLKDAALAIATHMNREKVLFPEDYLTEILKRELQLGDSQAGDALDGLYALGFIWDQDEPAKYRAGIPTLMDYAIHRSRETEAFRKSTSIDE